MDATPQPEEDGAPPPEAPLPAGARAVLLLGPDAEVLGATCGAELLTGRPPGGLRGVRLPELLTEPATWPVLAGADEPVRGMNALRHPDGRAVEVELAVCPLLAEGPGRLLVALTPGEAARRREEDQALVRALFDQRRVGLAIHDAELLISRINLDPGTLLTGTPGPPKRLPAPLESMVVPEDAQAILERLRTVAVTGEPLAYWEHSARLVDAPDRERVLAISGMQLLSPDQLLLGIVSLFNDITEQHQSRRRMDLLHTAAKRIGASLDVHHNAEALTRVLVPEFADLAAVDLAEAVLGGDEPGPALSGAALRRVATTFVGNGWPADVFARGAAFHIEHLDGPGAAEGLATLEPGEDALRVRAADTGAAGPRARELLPAGGSRMVLALRARGQVLGCISLWRGTGRTRFTRQDADLAEEVGSRAALSVDNARRYTREHRTLETLQRSLLPQPVYELTAAKTAGSYVPAGTAAGIGGGWYDVIPLSSARVAFVIGDVAGHGLSATATMGRLRTAVQTLADLDLAPDELLTRLDDLAIRLADTPRPGGSVGGAIGATCLYCVYDPVSGGCSMAAAGRLPPLVARPGEPAVEAPLKAGPPLGVGGTPFESVRVRVDPGSLLVFYSEELVAQNPQNARPARDPQEAGEGAEAGEGGNATGGEARQADAGGGVRDAGDAGGAAQATDAGGAGEGRGVPGDEGPTREERARLLRERVTAEAAAGHSPAEIGQALLDALLPRRAPANDVALLVAQVRPLPPAATMDWQFPAEPAVVGRARDVVIAQLVEWGLAGNAFPTELIVSELVTNAIRYAGGPVGLRLIRDETLVCEVSDPSETQPHLRRARPTDEGGRGLFLVAQLAHRWGSRYTAAGKTIWTEQPLDRG
ncbi:ATP-binding SpoIIE family protein phosphatase [Streptomyces hoynatensis]|uniref:PPM-type phosphatase domain-containing protein n=1 Tax=Streptomyces hoynatensis TaxID=1141874 RepID=A0A3A9Z8F7_9ACTN|nr:SpoIIE family protein phosphatase [Streptomyces hoynatensis]RKN44792.1 hypothetical protein D7294_06610 [Streptomyces hoynatensis]